MQDQASVASAEAEGVRDSDIDRLGARLSGDQVQTHIRIVEIDRRGNRSVAHGCQARDGFEAPAAVSRCPVMLLVDVTGIRSRASWKTSRSAEASVASPTGVLVAWALMWSTCSASTPASSSAWRMAAAAWIGSGLGMTWW